MESETQEEEWANPFYIVHQQNKRDLPITAEALVQANKCNYDILTSPITTDYFHSRVLALLSKNLPNSELRPRDVGGTGAELRCPIIPPLSLLDAALAPGDVTSQLLAVTSSWIDICSPDPVISGVSKQILCLEIAYAAFCGIENVLIHGPRLYHDDSTTFAIPQFARAIQESLSIGNHLQISILLPMIDHPDSNEGEDVTDLARFTRAAYLDEFEDRSKRPDLFGTWDAWNIVRSTCKYSSRLSVALCLPAHLPPFAIQSRWYSEPIKAICLPAESFVHNRHGSPALSTAAQSFICRLMRVKLGPWIILQNVGSIPPPDAMVEHEDGSLSLKPLGNTISPTPAEIASFNRQKIKEKDPLAHLRYIRELQRRQPPRTSIEKYGSGYQDYLQVPLQPLTDNLESVTYEVFEKDPVKYNLYEEAIRRALRDWSDKKKPVSGLNGRVVVAVAGAGRGPLVTRALQASEAEAVAIEIWAVEKNPNAYVLLQQRNRQNWGGRVNIIQSDMRSWKGPWREDFSPAGSQAPTSTDAGPSSPSISVPSSCHYPIDLLISELLGSFADNELSPECLDGIIHLLAPGGISIPRAYTAYLTPIAAPKLHADLATRIAWDPNAQETPAVVWLHAIDYLSFVHTADKLLEPKTVANLATDPKFEKVPNILPAWSFSHVSMAEKQQLPISNSHNTRFARLEFRTRDRGACHGLAGYFESVLYPGVELSTNPNTMEEKSKAMISWFPIYFPLKTPMYIPDHASLTISIWRQTDNRKVWYEWMVESWGWNLVAGGEKRRIRLGVSELHTSIKSGCMM